MKCKICGTRLENNAAKCPACGAVVGDEQNTAQNNVADSSIEKSICPACGKSILGEHRFCPYCGENLKEPEVVDGQGENERQSFTQQSGQEQEEKNTHDFSVNEELKNTVQAGNNEPQEDNVEKVGNGIGFVLFVGCLGCFLGGSLGAGLGCIFGGTDGGNIGITWGVSIGMIIGICIGISIKRGKLNGKV